jgi:tetratricopeptide (TPR) repeat protein
LKKNKIFTIADEFEPEAGVEQALKVLAKAPKDPESYLLMTEAVLENERFDQALMWVNRGLLYHPQHPGLLFKKASILIDGYEEIDEAFLILMALKRSLKNKSLAALKKDLGSFLLLDIYLLLADCYRIKSKFNDAMAHAIIAKEIAPFDENALLALSTAYFEIGEYDKALKMIEPVEKRVQPADFHWLKAQILCAQNNFQAADRAFLQAVKTDQGRYHRPVRFNEIGFLNAFNQALMALPREIREFIETTAVEINEIVPIDVVKNSNGTMSPQACIVIQSIKNAEGQETKIICIFKKNIENLARKKEEVKDLIASALLHEIGELI